MNALQVTVAVPCDGPAVVTLPQPLTAETVGRLEQALAAALDSLRRDPRGRSGDAGAIEYASWMPYLRPTRP